MSETAKRTGGPRTRKGKARAAQNAVTHGVTALTVAPSERAAYAQHLADVVASLGPVGPLEQRLAERVALTLWRLRRLEVWEAATIAADQRKRTEWVAFGGSRESNEEHQKRSAKMSVEVMESREVRSEIARLTHEDPVVYLRNLDHLEEVGRNHISWGDELAALSDPPTKTQAKRLSLNAAAYLGMEFITALELWEVPARQVAAALGFDNPKAADYEDFDPEGTDIPALWQLVDQEAAKRNDRGAQSRWMVEAARQRYMGERMVALAARVRYLIEQANAEALMLCSKDLDRVQRYEAHLERVLYRALHELEAMRDRRAGKAAPLARLDVHGHDADQ